MTTPLPSNVAAVAEVRVDARGRDLYARRAIRRGELVFSEKPFSWAVKLEHVAHFCSACLKRLSEQCESCDKCDVLRYCSIACRREHLPIHKLECPALRNITSQSFSPPDIVGLARMLLVVREITKPSQNPSDPTLAHAAQTLPLAQLMAMSAMRSFPESEFVRVYLNLACQGDRPISLESIVDWYRRNSLNSLSLDDDDWAASHPAIGIYPAVINHDCDPNCHWSNNGPTLNVRARRDIAQGEELSISYVPLPLTTEQRRDELTRYGFVCTCRRCSDSDNADGLSLRDRQLTGYRCRSPCQGLIAWNGLETSDVVRCPECWKEWSGEELDKRTLDVKSMCDTFHSADVITANMVIRLLRMVNDGFAPHHLIIMEVAVALGVPGVPLPSRIAGVRRVIAHALHFGDDVQALMPRWTCIGLQSQIDGVGDIDELVKLIQSARELIGTDHRFCKKIAEHEGPCRAHRRQMLLSKVKGRHRR